MYVTAAVVVYKIASVLTEVVMIHGLIHNKWSRDIDKKL